VGLPTAVEREREHGVLRAEAEADEADGADSGLRREVLTGGENVLGLLPAERLREGRIPEVGIAAQRITDS
jgi:hypothetical protein